MRFLKFLALTLVVALGFSSCKQNGDDHDHTSDLTGTWTCLTANFAEALIINEDGSVVSTGSDGVDYWENVAGNIVVENGKVTLTFENGNTFKGHIDVIPGMAFSIEKEDGVRLTFNYCENDLSEEVVGMWVVANGTPDMTIETFNEDGTAIFTGVVGEQSNLNSVINYKVVGDLMFYTIEYGQTTHIAYRLIYSPNATSYGDLMTWQLNDNFSFTRLRVKQYLNLEGEVYAYSTAYVSNAKGTDEDLSMLGHTFNMANIGAVDFDVVFGADLYIVELNAESITHKFRPNGQDVEVVTPITVEGNKVTLDYSAVNPSCRKVEMYMFQDKDDTQLHMYMPTASFVNYFANLWLPELIAEGELDPTDTAAVEKVYKDMEARIESINVSFVMKALK